MPLEQCSNLPPVQTRNIAFCYNKEGIITKVITIPQDKGHTGIQYDTIKLTSINTMQTRIAQKLKFKKLLCEQSHACHFAYTS